MITGESLWRSMDVMAGNPSPFGSQAAPPNEDVDNSRQDATYGYDQAYTMDRMVQAIPTLANGFQPPAGRVIAPDHVALDLERNQGNDAWQVAPQLRNSNLGARFGSYVNLIQWAPEPGQITSYGDGAPVRDDVLPQYAKAMPTWFFGTIDTQALLDAAVEKTRKALYG